MDFEVEDDDEFSVSYGSGTDELEVSFTNVQPRISKFSMYKNLSSDDTDYNFEIIQGHGKKIRESTLPVDHSLEDTEADFVPRKDRMDGTSRSVDKPSFRHSLKEENNLENGKDSASDTQYILQSFGP